ncbi:hypothetical protein [Nonomuraea sp. NBC_00507]
MVSVWPPPENSPGAHVVPAVRDEAKGRRAVATISDDDRRASATAMSA